MKINDPNYQRKCFRFPRRPVAKLIGALVLLGIFSACTDELEQNQAGSGKGTTATLELSLSVPPMLETKAVVCEADSGSEARKAGFYYEMQVLTTDTTATDRRQVATKAEASLQNVYAFLFTSTGAFNGRASVGSAGTEAKLSLEFTGIVDAAATGGRLVIIANDASATVDYASSTAFASFSGTYAEFQNLTLTSAVTSDVNIPYVGSATVSLFGGGFSNVPTVRLYRMLAKIVLTNNTFDISGGPARDSINLYNAGHKYFGTPNNDGNGYNGVGETPTASTRYITTATAGSNANSNTWYVGENVQNAAADAAYIELGTGVGGGVTNPSVGKEYIAGVSFKYKVYLNSYALKRNNVYNITVNVSGTLDRHITLASQNSNVSMTGSVEKGGLNIGKFGGASGYTTGAGSALTITGSYTKNLLIQPNTTGTTATDNITRKWSNNTTLLQSETRKYWDRTYALAHIDKTAGLAYDYCYQLQLGGVAKGTWYLPTQAQLMAMWGILRGIKGNSSYADYSAFNANVYWSATENTANNAWTVDFSDGYVDNYGKTNSYYVRCVRDLP